MEIIKAIEILVAHERVTRELTILPRINRKVIFDDSFVSEGFMYR